jgi:hypothetical protein
MEKAALSLGGFPERTAVSDVPDSSGLKVDFCFANTNPKAPFKAGRYYC